MKSFNPYETNMNFFMLNYFVSSQDRFKNKHE
jgi:hypothetical protein